MMDNGSINIWKFIYNGSERAIIGNKFALPMSDNSDSFNRCFWFHTMGKFDEISLMKINKF